MWWGASHLHYFLNNYQVFPQCHWFKNSILPGLFEMLPLWYNKILCVCRSVYETVACSIGLFIQKSLTQFLIFFLFSDKPHFPLSFFFPTFFWIFMLLYFSIYPVHDTFMKLSLSVVCSSICFLLLLWLLRMFEKFFQVGVSHFSLFFLYAFYFIFVDNISKGF